MSIVSCQCGQRFQAAAHLAGQRVPCPACGAAIHVPAASKIPVQCGCGGRFQADAALAGKTVKCPSCQQALRVPAADAAAAAPLPRSEPDPFDLGQFGTTLPPAPRVVRPSPASNPGLNRWVIATIAGGAAFVLLFIIGYSAGTWFASQGEDGQGLVEGTNAAETSAQTKIDDELARMRAAGEPVSAAELERYYALPAGAKDVTQLWISGSGVFLTDAFVAEAAGTGEHMPPPGQPWPGLQPAQQLLRKYRSQFDQLHEAGRGGGAARYPTSFKDGLVMDMPHLQDLMAAAQLLRLEAHVRTREGDLAGAVESLTTIFAMGRSVENYPHFVGQLVCWATTSNGFSALEDIVPYVEFSDAELLRLAEALEQSQAENGLHTAMLGERVLGFEALQDPNTLLKNLTSEDVEDARRLTQQQADEFAKVAPLVKERDSWFFLQHMRGLVEAAEKPWPQPLTMADQEEKKWNDLAGQNYLKKEDFASIRDAAEADRAVLAHLVVPPLKVSFDSHARFIALLNLTKTVIAVERYRNQHGQPPETLQALTADYLPSIPVDPFTGKSLPYVREADRYRVYSVGLNRKDDQGRGSLTGQDEDLVFSVALTQQLAQSALRAVSDRSPVASARQPQANAGQPGAGPNSFAGRPRPGSFAPPPIGTPTGTAFEDSAPARGYLVGVRIVQSDSGAVHVLQPLYLVDGEMQPGKQLGGSPGNDTVAAVAKPGYAVGGISARRGSSAITAIQLIFYRISGSKMDPQDKYESDWLGGTDERGKGSVQFGGRFIVKIAGTFQDDVTSLQIYPGDP